MLAIAFTIVSGLACAVLVAGEYRDANRVRFAAKPLASLAFILVGVCAASRGEIHEFEMAVLAGLVLGAIGDVALLSEHGFLAGLGAFLLGHLAYVVAVGSYLPPSAWPHAAGVYALVPLVVGLGVLAWLWPKLGSLRIPVIAYVAVITTMVIGALVCEWAVRNGPIHQHVATAGAILFFASDLSVARDRFVHPGFVNRAWGLPAYYAGQLLFAWACAG